MVKPSATAGTVINPLSMGGTQMLVDTQPIRRTRRDWVLMELSREGKLTGRRISGGKYHPEGHDFDIWPAGMPWLKLRPDTVERGEHPSQACPVD